MKNYMWCLLAITMVAIGCKKEEDTDDTNKYTAPETYVFEDANGNSTVDFSGQQARLNQLSEMVTYIKTGNTSGTVLSAQQLKDMYANTNDNGAGHFTFTAAGKQLKNKTFATDQTLFESYMDSIAVASTSTTAGSNGVAGVVESNDQSKAYLLAASGIEYGQLIEKGLMGAVFYYQALAEYLGDDKVNVDNTAAVDAAAGKYYTQMEHHWDEAFGYFTDATDYPANGTDRFWGKYADARDEVINCNTLIMDAFLLGRAAVSANDIAVRDEQIAIIKAEWEKVVATTLISYLKGAKANFTDDAIRCHQLSEGIGFAMSLKYNPDKKISNAQIDEVLGHIGTNLYDVTIADLDAALNVVVFAYGFDNALVQQI